MAVTTDPAVVERLIAQLQAAMPQGVAPPGPPLTGGAALPVRGGGVVTRPGVTGALSRARDLASRGGATGNVAQGVAPELVSRSGGGVSSGAFDWGGVPRTSTVGPRAPLAGVGPSGLTGMSPPAGLSGGGATLAQAESAASPELFARGARGAAPGAFEWQGANAAGVRTMPAGGVAPSTPMTAVAPAARVAALEAQLAPALAAPTGPGLPGAGGGFAARSGLPALAQAGGGMSGAGGGGGVGGGGVVTGGGAGGIAGGAGSGGGAGGAAPAWGAPTSPAFASARGVPFGGAGWLRQGLGRVGGVKGLGMRAGTAAGAGLAANWAADKLTGDEWNGSVDDSIESAAGWGTAGAVAGATIGAPFFGIGALPGAAIGAGIGTVAGGLHGWLTGNDSEAKQSQQTNEKLSGKFDALAADFGLSADSRKVLDGQIAAALYAAETPEQIKEVYAQAATLLPQFMAQDAAVKEESRVSAETDRQRAARAAAVQAYIMPMMQAQMRQTDQYANETAQVMSSAAQTVRDPQLRAIYAAQASRVPYENARQSQNMLNQQMLAQAAYAQQYQAEQDAYAAAADRYATNAADQPAAQFDDTTAQLMAQLGL